MAHDFITVDRRAIQFRRAVISPAWKDEKVLTSDIWTYVDLWIRRNAKGSAAQFYWQQSRDFYKAAQGLPVTSAPLAIYYCFLNAAKTLLSAKNLPFSDLHGVTGHKVADKASLSNERVIFKAKGVLPALASYYGESPHGTYSLKELLGNMSFVHRAYCLSYSEPYHFFSIFDPVYVKARGSSEAWVSFGMETRFDDQRVLGTLPPGYQKNVTFSDELVVRKKKRFKWESGSKHKSANFNRLTNYHKQLRRDITYVAGADRWYLKRRHSNLVTLDRHTPTLIFSAMHRLSELSRYDPIRLSRILDTQRNWIIAEFVKSAATQFLDEIACEITGQEIYAPGIHVGNSLSIS